MSWKLVKISTMKQAPIRLRKGWVRARRYCNSPVGSATTCTLYGFPGVSFTGETSAVQVGPAATRNHASPEQVVTLAPGAVASALVKIVNAQNYPAGTCGLTTASGINVYPPNLTSAASLPYNGFACVHKYNVLTVNAVVAGPGT